jgi:hypothetical protein
VPKADKVHRSKIAGLFDNLVGGRLKRQRNAEPERMHCFEIDYQLKLRRPVQSGVGCDL